MKIQITTSKGRAEVDGRRFSHYVDGVRFWFAFHKATDHAATYVVTHIESGKRVCFVPHIALAAALGDDIAAARGEIDKLVARVGAPRARSVLVGG